MDYSTAVTERLVKMMSEDTIKVLVDYPEAKETNDNVDTGLWQILEKGTYVKSIPLVGFGVELEVTGRSISKSNLI
jgi:hypothetical protein